jgi:serine phosphatase RsbU (regulator of sigma subunit)
MASHTTFVIEDASVDPRFSASPLVTGEPFVRAYIGQALRAGGQVIGSFAMAGHEPRVFSQREQEHFRQAAGWIEEELARETDLVRAAEVQKSLLPRKAPFVDGYEIAGASTPSRSVGGDFYDWYPVPDGLGFTLADVMGKGVGAAIVAATVRAVIRTSAPDSGTVATVTRAAKALDEDLSDTDSFVTLFHAKLRQRDGRVRYVDAGHGLTLVVRADGTFSRLAHEDLPLGTAFDCTWHRHTVWLGVGDTLLAFSDGVLDLFDGTVASLADVVAMVVHGNSITEVVASLTSMAELDTDTDDVVVLGIRRTAP